jgi:hypothetical protein
MPLIHHIESLHAGFIAVLIAQLTSQLLNEPIAPVPGIPSARDGSYDSFIAAWVVYLLDTQTLSGGDEDANQELMNKANIIPIVMGGLGPLGFSTLLERKT